MRTFLFNTMFRTAMGPSMCWRLFLRLNCEANHITPTAKVQNVLCFISIPSMHFHGKALRHRATLPFMKGTDKVMALTYTITSM